MNMAASLVREKGIVINTNLKKSGVHSDRAIVIKKIPIDTPKKMIVTVLIGIWQKAVVEFAKLSQANLLVSRWSFLIRKNSMRVVKAVRDYNIWTSRDHFRALLFTLPVETTAHDLGTLLDRAGSKTCIINRSLNTGNRFCCAVVGFESEKDLDLAFCTEPVFGGMWLSWARLNLVRCGKCGCFGHLALECDAPVGSMLLSSSVKSFKGFVSEKRCFQLVKLYKKKEVPIFHPVAFVVSVASPLSRGFSAGPSSNFLSSSYHDIGNVSSLNECLAFLECSFELLSDQVSTIVRCLDNAELVSLVPSSFVSPLDASVSLASGSGSDMILDGTSILSASSSSTVDVGVHVLSSSSFRIFTNKVGGLKSKLASLEASIGSVLAHLDGLCFSSIWKFTMCNVWGLNVPAKQADIVYWHVSSESMVFFVTEMKLRPFSGPWIKDKFERVWIFTSGLDVGYFGAGIAVIMNNSLACHVFKVEMVSGHVISIHLLFKGKLLVTVLGLYAGAFSGICFGLIVKAVASTTFKKRDQKPLVTFSALSWKQHSKNKFKVVTTPDATTLEYYQSIYIHYKQRFNISDGIEVVKKSVYQYIENRINNYLFGNYNISEVRSNLYNNLAHYSQLETEDLNSETLATYFQELNFNIIKYCEETYPVQSQYSIDFKLETETSNKSKHKLKQYSKTTPNTPILPKTTAKHLQTPEQETKNFTSLRSPIRQQELLQTSSNFFDFLAENQSEHSETAANKENNSEITEEKSIDSENEKDKMTAYITKIPEFNGENIETSSQEWLDQVTKARDANEWNAARMLRTILYFLKGTAGELFENLAIPFNDWNTFKAAFLEQFTDNNTSITL
ncbi:hypothetical protein G9A89_005420 [Geosiphon pyriformis]|nr:hypothetical protein G9A89_005420 [Geosiphon pyriformis]